MDEFAIPGVNSFDLGIAGLPDSRDPSMGSSNRRVHNSSNEGTVNCFFRGSHTLLSAVTAFTLLAASPAPLFSALGFS